MPSNFPSTVDGISGIMPVVCKTVSVCFVPCRGPMTSAKTSLQRLPFHTASVFASPSTHRLLLACLARVIFVSYAFLKKSFASK